MCCSLLSTENYVTSLLKSVIMTARTYSVHIHSNADIYVLCQGKKITIDMKHSGMHAGDLFVVMFCHQ